jgi:sigma-B regulation protein RsbU (phosphoserine phosphatase)
MPSSRRAFFETYTKDFTKEDLGKLFTYETPEAYKFFARGINTAELEGLPWHRRAARYLQGFFLAFTMRLSPARRVIYGMSLVAAAVGLIQLFDGFGLISVTPMFPFNFIRIRVPGPIFSHGTLWLSVGFLMMNLLVLLEVADRLSLKRDLEVAREIQQAMLPEGLWSNPGVEAFGLTKPATSTTSCPSPTGGSSSRWVTWQEKPARRRC